MLSDKQLADAFRLMVKAQLFVDVGRRTTFVHDETGAARITVEHDTIVHKGDAVAAACQAVTEAAAACGVAPTAEPDKGKAWAEWREHPQFAKASAQTHFDAGWVRASGVTGTQNDQGEQA